MENTWGYDPFSVAGGWGLSLPIVNPVKDKSKTIFDLLEKALIAGQSIMKPINVSEIIIHGKLINDADVRPSETSPIHKDKMIPFTPSPLRIKQMVSDDLNKVEKENINEVAYFSLLHITGQALISNITDSGDIVTEWFPPVNKLEDSNEFNYVAAFSIGFDFSMDEPNSIILSMNTACSIWGYLTNEGDNNKLARINNPRLVAFLKEIERVFNTSINDWGGQLGMKVGQYGFLPDSLKDRQCKKTGI